MRIRQGLFAGIAALCAFAGATAHAADFPQRQIRILVPFPPGSGTDGSARVLAQEITKATGQTVVVENKAGANGFIATEEVMRAPADGYTLLLTSNTHVANKFLFKRTPYDPIQDFKGITLLKEGPLVLLVRADSPIRDAAGLTRAARAAKTPLAFGSGNSSSRVAAELYKQLEQVDMLYVPYKGNPLAIGDLIGGRIDLIFADSTSATPLIRGGKVRAIATTGRARTPNLQDVPTLIESGLADFNLGSWLVVLAPRDTPDPVVDRLNRLFRDALQTETVKRNFLESDAVPLGTSRQELADFMTSENRRWGSIIQKAGIQPE